MYVSFLYLPRESSGLVYLLRSVMRFLEYLPHTKNWWLWSSSLFLYVTTAITQLTSNSWKIKCNFLCRIATIAQETSFATLTPKSHAPGQFSHRLMSWKPNSLKSHISEKSSSNIEEGLKVSTSVLTKLLADGVSPLHFCFSTVPWEAASFWNNFPLDALEFASQFPAIFFAI